MQLLRGRRGVLAVAFGAALVVASLAPASGASAPTFELFGVVGLDKVAHAGGFLVLTLLAAHAAKGRRALLAVVAVTVLLGGGIEIAQTAIPGRTFEVADFVADVVGVVAAVAVHRWLQVARPSIPGAKPL